MNNQAEEFYKPLTPDFRAQIMDSIDKQRAEISCCQPSCYASAYTLGLNALESIIKALPDAFPIPCRRNGG